MKNYKDIEKHLSENQYTWLITGVAGFIGSNLLERLLRLNQKVVGLDDFSTGHQKNIDTAIKDASNFSNFEVKKNFKFVEGDISNINHCLNASRGVDFILHHAALGSVPRSIKDPLKTNIVNINGFLNILESTRKLGIKSLVYAASSSTYGDHKALPKREENIGSPLSPYAVTKLVNELYADVYAKVYDIKTIGLRYFNIFGKRQDPKGSYAAVIPKWIDAIINGEDVYINGDGSTSRDFCYIENVIRINLIAALTTNSLAYNNVFNVALGDRTSLSELHSIILKKIAAKLGKCSISNLKFRDFRTGDVMHSQADIEKLKNLLNFKPTYHIDLGLEETIDWYVDNKEYFK